MINHQKDDVFKSAAGMWPDIIRSITDVPHDAFSKKHQSCPNCGGKDRFRYDDNRTYKGDGGYICSGCGGGDGLDLLMKLSGVGFSEAVNLVGSFTGGITPEKKYEVDRVIQHSAAQEKYGEYLDHEDCSNFISQCDVREDSLITRQQGICPEKIYTMRMRDGINIVLPIVFDNRHDILCGAAIIKPGEYLDEFDVSFTTKRQPHGGVHVLSKREGKKDIIMLCESWMDGYHANFCTGVETWICFTPENMAQIAHRNKMKHMMVACTSDNKEVIHVAADYNLKVALPKNNRWNSGMIPLAHNAEALL